MKNKVKTLLSASLIAAMTFGSSVPAFALADETPITVHVDGKYVSTDVTPYVSNGRTYLPLRAAAETMGANVVWDQASRTATVTKGGTVIRCTVGSTVYTINGVSQYADAAPQIVEGRTMLPIRPIAEALGGTLYWDGTTGDASIDTHVPDASAPNIPETVPYQVRWLVEKYYVHPEGTGVGSWIWDATSAVSNSFEHAMLSISQMADGSRHGIRVTWFTDEYGRVTDVHVDDHEITQYANGFHLKDDWTPFYWAGGDLGTGGPIYKLENFEYIGNDLKGTGYWTICKDPNYSPSEHGKWYHNDTYYVRF